jgi:hypothetical protein
MIETGDSIDWPREYLLLPWETVDRNYHLFAHPFKWQMQEMG